MKAVWKGSIAFGLVNIPVKLFSAVEQRAIHFRLLHGKDNSPIHYKRICNKCGKEVPWKDVVKGVEYARGKYAAITKEKIEHLLQPNTKKFYQIFYQCQSCQQIYWKGSHYERMQQFIAHIRAHESLDADD